MTLQTLVAFNSSLRYGLECLLRACKPLLAPATRDGGSMWLVAFLSLVFVSMPVNAATFTVTKTADTNDGTCDADCSLREAIASANAASDADIVSVPAGTYIITLAGTDDTNALGDFDITNPVNIVGAGSGSTIIQEGTSLGTAVNRIFHVTNSSAVTLDAMKVQFGKITATGGCILAVSDITIKDSIVDSCTATSNNGGAIYSGGAVTIDNSTVSTGTAGLSGGGIYTYGMTITNGATIQDNYAASKGGGIYNNGSANAITGDGTIAFTNNDTAKSTNDNGGAIYSDGDITFTGTSNFTNNDALNGGAIFIGDAASTVILSTPTFDTNTVTGAGGGLYTYGLQINGDALFQNNYSSGAGGGVYSKGANAINITGTATFTNNDTQKSTNDRGGAIWAEGDVTIDGVSNFSNNGGEYGGAIYLNSSLRTITLNSNATFDTNTSAVHGGALYTYGLTVNGNLILSNNTATGGGAGAYSLGSNNVYVSGDLTLTNNDTGLSTNDTGGGIHSTDGNLTVDGATSATGNAAYYGGGIYLGTGSTTLSGGATFTFNSASIHGGAIQTNGLTITGGATFQDNTTGSGEGAVYSAGANAVSIDGIIDFSRNTGGGIKSISGNVSLNPTTGTSLFDQNTGADAGGAIYAGGSTTITGNASFTSNTTTVHGGAIYTSGLSITGNATFQDNYAAGAGGGVYSLGANPVNITGTATFTNNDTPKGTNDNGGGIWSEGNVTVTGNANFTNNDALSGGGIYLNVSTATVSFGADATLDTNTVSGGGGAIRTYGLSVTNNLSMTGNSSGSAGGGIYSSGANDITIGGNATLTNNDTGLSTDDNGGAIYLATADLSITGSVTADDNDALNGGTIYLGAGSTTISGGASFINGNAVQHAGTIYTYGLTISGGTGATFTDNASGIDGGAIRSAGANPVSIDGTIVFDNNDAGAASAEDGGGIYAEGDVTLNPTSGTSTFKNGHAWNGGGIYTTGSLTATRGITFDTNTGVNAGGAIYAAGGELTGVTFSNNSVTNDGGAIYNITNLLTINGSGNTFTNNYGGNSSSGPDEGGVIYSSGSLTISNATFSARPDLVNSSYNGGAINLKDTGDVLTLSSVSFDDFKAGNVGGAIRMFGGTLTNVTITDSAVANDGGAIHNSTNTLTINGTANTFTNNYGGFSSSGSDEGGTIYSSGSLTISNAAFTGRNDGTADAYQGGAISVIAATDVVTISDSSFASYKSGNVGGAIRMLGGTLTDVTFTDNISARGGAIYNSGAALNFYGGNLMSGNTATGTSGQAGGAVYSASVPVTINDAGSVIKDNTGTGSGGAFYVSSTFNVLGATIFENNSSTTGGGAFISVGGSITDSIFDSNQTTGGVGGGAYFVSTAGSIKNSSFISNTASTNGGAFYSNVAGNKFINSTFSANSSNNGGAIYHAGACTIKNSTFYNNTATSNSGHHIGCVSGTISNSIVYSSPTPGAGDLCYGVPNGTDNLKFGDPGTSVCGTVSSTNDPALNALAYNGGPTQTHALQGTGDAIASGNTTICADTDVNSKDQRGATRPTNCDLGAYEYGGSAGDTAPPSPVADLATGTVGGTTVDLSWTAPGDDYDTGTATTYDIRYSTSPINEGNWASASVSTDEVAPNVAGISESVTITGLSGSTLYYFAIKTADEVPNTSIISNIVSATTTVAAAHTAPFGGYTVDNVIPTAQVTQSTNGDAIVTINFRVKDAETDGVTLNSFEYSIDGGSVWNAPTNGDASTSLSTNWEDNGSSYSTATNWTGTIYSFTFDADHADITGISGIDQSDIQIRFTVNDATDDSVAPATSESFQVDDAAPTATITSAGYNKNADILVITGTNFTSIADAATDVKSYVDWTKFVWDINGDNASTANITFVEADVTSATVTDATTLTIVFTGAKGTAIEGTAGYASAGGVDTLDVTAGFSIDVLGNVATTDAVADGALTTNTAPFGGYTADNVIPTAQVTQSSSGDGIMTINFRIKDGETDTATLNTFEYSVDGGSSWNAPTNGDTSTSLSTNWEDNGTSYSSAAGWSGTVHNFTFDTDHADSSGMAGVDQSDIQIRFIVNDGTIDSAATTSQNFRVNNVTPTATIASGNYDADTNTLTVTGTNFTTIADTATDIKSYVDWSKFVWDINGDNATTANITFVEADVTSATVTNATTLTVIFTSGKGIAIESNAAYGTTDGADTLDVSAGFSIDAAGNVSTTDAVADGPLDASIPTIPSFDVTKTADTNDGTCDADCSLREAIKAANDSAGLNQVNVPAGTYTITITDGATGDGDDTNAEGDFDITDDVNILGAGSGLTIIQAATSSGVANRRVFDVTNSSAVTIEAVTVRFGYVRGYGGCIHAVSDITIKDSVIDSCTIWYTNLIHGGGIYSGGALTMENSTVSNNTSRHFGGGVSTSGGTLTDVTFTNNTVVYANGGAVFNSDNLLTINGSSNTFTDNYVPTSSADHGGSIYSTGNLTISNTAFTGRNNGTADAGRGGAIYLPDATGVLTLSDSSFTNFVTYLDGGAIRMYGGTMSNVTFTNNEGREAHGGAIANYTNPLTITGTNIFGGNRVGTTWQDFGGSVYSSGSLTISGATFTGRNNGSTDAGRGGGIYATADLDVSTSTFKDLKDLQQGGAIRTLTGAITNSTFSNNSSASGGALYCGTSCTVKNSTFSNNTATGNGDTIEGATTVYNSIITSDTDLGSTMCRSVTSGDYNLQYNGTCFTALANDLSSDPHLIALADNGGPTLTYGLHPSSPAIDAADNAICASAQVDNVDQRGFIRPYKGRYKPTCDMGAFEYGSPPVDTTTSAWFDSGSVGNRIWSLNWTENLPTDTDIRIQLRSAPNNVSAPGSASGWMGPDGTSNTYWNSEDTRNGGCYIDSGVSCTSMPSALKDGVNDQWFQYQVKQFSSHTEKPTYSAVNVLYSDAIPPGVTLNKSSGLNTSEDLLADSFTVVLDTVPSGTVTITLSSSPANEVAFTSSTIITFNAGDWSVPKTVNIVGVNDDYDDDATAYTIYATPSSSVDAAYNVVAKATVTGINSDNDTAGISVNITPPLVTTESGGSDSFTIQLDSKPKTDVIISTTSGNVGEGRAHPRVLTFTGSNWSVAQTVTVTGLDDRLDDGDTAYSILATTVSGDSDYHDIDLTYQATNIDNDTKGVTITPSSGLITSEAGGTATFTVVLNTALAANVTLNFASDDHTEGSVSPSTANFISSNWNSPQTITITGEDDLNLDSDQAYNIITTVSSLDTDYSGLSIPNVAVTNVDDEAVDNGSSFSQTRWSTATPTNAPTCAAANGSWDGEVCNAVHSSNQAGWGSYVSTGGDIVFANGALEGLSIGSAVLTSTAYDTESTNSVISHLDWNQTLPANTDVRIQLRTAADNAGKPNVWTPWVGPDGLASSYWNSINTYSGGCSDSAGAISCDNLPAVIRNGQTNRWLQYKVTLITNGASAPALHDVKISYVAGIATNIDVSPLNLTTDETGTQQGFNVTLTGAAPTNSVTVDVAVSDPTEGSLSTQQLIFAAGDNGPKLINVLGVDDVLDDGNISYTVYTSAAVSADAAYDNHVGANIVVNNTDDETGGAAINVTPTSGLVVSEDGTTQATFDIQPATAPSANVTIAITSSDLSEATVSPAIVTLLSGSAAAVTVTVTGVQENMVDNDVTFDIVLDPAVSVDTNYDGIDPSDVSVTTVDDDSIDIVVSNGPFITSETGGMAQAFVQLTAPPSVNTTINLSTSDGSEGRIFSSSITFTPTNWNVDKGIYIYGVNDAAQDGDINYSIITSPFVTTDPTFVGIDPQDIPVTNTDDDSPSVTTRLTDNLETSEDGGSSYFIIVLGSKPANDVVFSLTSNDPDEGTVPATVVFNADDNSWYGTIVTVTGVDDYYEDSDQAFTISGSYASADPNYASGTIADITVINRSANTSTFEVNMASANSGRSVAFADVNNDQLPDLIIGSPGYSSDTGRVSIYHGTGTGYNSTPSLALNGIGTGDLFGFAVATAGDINNDGYDDIIVGAHGYNSNQGAVYIFSGSATGLNPIAQKTLTGSIAGDMFGYSVSGNGQFNNDSYADVIIGAYGYNSGNGRAEIYHGAATINSMTLGWSDDGQNAGENFGYSVAVAGNIDNDHYDDLIIGAPAYSNGEAGEGRVYAYHTDASGLLANPAWTKESDFIQANFGKALSSAGDINNDGFADVAVGAPGYDNGQPGEGWVFIYHGSNTGLSAIADTTLEVDQSNAEFGISVAALGDVNLDGYDDIIVGASQYDDKGRVFIYQGSATSLMSAPFLSENSTQVGSNYGVAVGGNIDINADGYNDYAVGADLYDNPSDAEGRVFVYRRAPDVQGVRTLNNSDLKTTEAGAKAYFDIVLSAQPTADVIIALSSDNLAEGLLNKELLKFTPLNWQTAQNITVTGQDDAINDGSVFYNIHAVVTSVDVNYDGIAMASVPIVNIDNDITVSVVISDANVGEAGSNSGTFTLFRTGDTTASLNAYYSMGGTAVNGSDYNSLMGVVTIPAGQGSVDITVIPVNDEIADSSETIDLTIANHSSYLVGSPATAVMTIVDDDTFGITVSPTIGLITNEAGGSALFTIVLNTQPTDDVTIALSSDTPTEGRLVSSNVSFTSGNWDTAQTVTVVGQDDASIDGDVGYNIITAAAVSASDPNYNGLNAADVALTNVDDDALPNITIAATTASVNENSVAKGVFTITRLGSTATDLTVSYTVSGDATSGVDYYALGASSIIPTGSSSVDIYVVTKNDDSAELNEVVNVSLISGTGYIVSQPNAATVTIIDDDQPLLAVADFGLDQSVGDGSTVSVSVFLNKTATAYPVTIPYTVSGTATASVDHNAINGSIIISSGRSATVTFDVVDDGLGDPNETVVFTMGSLINSQTGARSTHTITIVEDNKPAMVTLGSTQGANSASLVVAPNGNVTITATVTDPNILDSHTYDWSLTNNNLVDILDADPATFVFDPSALANGFYKIRLSVTDNGTPVLPATKIDLLLEVTSTAPVLSFVNDFDNDGVTDGVESTGDIDMDGIADYMDDSTLAINELQMDVNQQGYILRTEAGLTLRLGDTALAAGSDGVIVTVNDISNYGGGEGDPGIALAQDVVANNGGYFDFEIIGLPEAGQSVRIVIPLQNAIPNGAIYRKYDPSLGWSDFVVNANNSVSSAPGAQGECPLPGDMSFTAGMNEGHYCVQLTIEDGGNNDMDGIANHVIEDPAQVGSVQISESPSETEASKETSSGGGSLSLIMILQLLLGVLLRIVVLGASSSSRFSGR